jgi:hypothetical protein
MYRDPAATVAMFRGYDAVALAVATPVLVGALAAARRGSARAQLIWGGTLFYVCYTYAYYVFGAAFGPLFLAHVALLVLAGAALGLLAVGSDLRRLGEVPLSRIPARTVSAVLALLGTALGGMWSYFSLRLAVTGAPVPDGLLVQPPPILHLGYAMDLSVLVPGYTVAAALLWRGRPSGLAVGSVLLIGSAFVQLTYVTALRFQSAAGVPGATLSDPQEPIIAAVIVAGAVALLRGVRARPVAAVA